MHAIIHIGTVKTGTSSIQSFLYDNRALLREQGVLYPQCLCDPDLVHRRRLADHNKLGLHLIFGWPGEVEAELREELAAAGCPRLLISAEILSEYMKTTQQVQALRAFLTALGCTQFTIAVWLRESGALFASLCSQWLKNGAPEYAHLMTPHSGAHLRSVLDSRALLQRWEEVFGREALTVRLFEPECFVQGDLLCDAAAAFGLQWDERFALPPRINESLNLPEMEVLRVISRLQSGPAYVPDTPKGLLFEVLHRHLGVLDAPGMRFVPPQAVTAAWREWAAEGNEWVRREFFPARPALFATPPAQAENYELTHLTPGCWEALGRAFAELSEETCSLRAEVRRLRGADAAH